MPPETETVTSAPPDITPEHPHYRAITWMQDQIKDMTSYIERRNAELTQDRDHWQTVIARSMIAINKAHEDIEAWTRAIAILHADAAEPSK